MERGKAKRKARLNRILLFPLFRVESERFCFQRVDSCRSENAGVLRVQIFLSATGESAQKDFAKIAKHFEREHSIFHKVDVSGGNKRRMRSSWNAMLSGDFFTCLAPSSTRAS